MSPWSWASPPWTAPSAVWGVVPTPPAPPGMWPRRTWSTCWMAWAWRRGSVWTPCAGSAPGFSSGSAAGFRPRCCRAPYQARGKGETKDERGGMGADGGHFRHHPEPPRGLQRVKFCDVEGTDEDRGGIDPFQSHAGGDHHGCGGKGFLFRGGPEGAAHLYGGSGSTIHPSDP